MANTKGPAPIAAVLEALPLAAAVKAVPKALYRSLQEIGRLDTHILALERAQAVRAAEIAANVLERKSEDGKALASNDLARKALIERETASDPECQRMATELAGLRRERSAVQADAEVLRTAAGLITRSPDAEHC